MVKVAGDLESLDYTVRCKWRNPAENRNEFSEGVNDVLAFWSYLGGIAIWMLFDPLLCLFTLVEPKSLS